MYSFILILFVILSICVWIHKPVVDIVIIVNKSLMFNGIFVIDRLFSDDVISVILSKNDFKYVLFIKVVGRIA